MMNRANQEEGGCRVLLSGLDSPTEEGKEAFSRAHVRKVRNRLLPASQDGGGLSGRPCERTSLSGKRENWLKRSDPFGAWAEVEVRRGAFLIEAEFGAPGAPEVGLTSSLASRSSGGSWQVIGLVKNQGEDPLEDLWVVVQLFDRRWGPGCL